jgi:hypothetical protein
MNRGRTVLVQLLEFVPFSHFEYLVDVYQANKGVREFTAWNHFICLAYAQLTRRSGLRDLVACLNAQHAKLYPIGIRGSVSRSTLADAAERRDYRLFEALGQRLITTALALYGDEDIGLGLKGPVYAMDATTIDLCLSLFPWAHFRRTKAAVKAHVMIDLRGAIPVFLALTTGKVHDVRLLNEVTLPPGSILVLDWGYLDFARLFALHRQEVGFVTRAKGNIRFTWLESRPIDRTTGLRADQTIRLVTPKSKDAYPARLRRVSLRDPETGKRLVFLTNLFDPPAATIAAIYKNRWQIELFFKWLKQNLAVKHFFGNSINAVKAQIWIAVCTYLLVLIAIKHHRLPVSPQIFMHLVETNIFEKITLDQLVANSVLSDPKPPDSNQLILI